MSKCCSRSRGLHQTKVLGGQLLHQARRNSVLLLLDPASQNSMPASARPGCGGIRLRGYEVELLQHLFRLDEITLQLFGVSYLLVELLLRVRVLEHA